MAIGSGKLDKRITIERAAIIDDGFSKVQGEPAPWKSFWANKADISDGEKVRAAQLGAEITTRFLVRSTADTRTITPKDQLVCHGRGGADRRFNIVGIKEVDPDGLEITASALADEE